MPAGSPRDAEPDWLARDFENAARGRRTVVLVMAALVAVGTAGALAWALLPALSPAGGRNALPAPVANTRAATPAFPTGSPAATRSATPRVPAKGLGTFSTANGGTRRVGHGGTLVRYAVRVEKGIGLQTGEFTEAVDTILAAPRGWTKAGKWSFQRVEAKPYDFVVTLASQDTSERLCAAAGMDTNGNVNCSAPGDVVINLKRWALLTPYYKGQSDLYHALAIDHEIGHRLGYGHMSCPGKGRPAPVMMQQIYGLHGCVPNGWPYDSRGRLITGPSVP